VECAPTAGQGLGVSFDRLPGLDVLAYLARRQRHHQRRAPRAPAFVCIVTSYMRLSVQKRSVRNLKDNDAALRHNPPADALLSHFRGLFRTMYPTPP
jgi:hypothetical protein